MVQSAQQENTPLQANVPWHLQETLALDPSATQLATKSATITPPAPVGRGRDQYEATQQIVAYSNPLHTQVSPAPLKTSWEVQLGLVSLPIRYVFRAFAKSATDSASPPILHKITGVEWLRDNIYLPGYIKEITARLQQFNPHVERIFPNGLSALSEDDITYAMKHDEDGKKLIDDIRKIQRQWDAGDLADNTIKYYLLPQRELSKHKIGGVLTHTSKARLRGKMNETIFETLFDNMLGGGSLYYTTKVQNNVRTDIMSVYREAVSYEIDKDPYEVDRSDMSDSSNLIVQSTLKNYDRKQMLRYGISLMPFMKNIPKVRALQWGEATIAAWGTLWAVDIMGRKPTMLETLRDFVNKKLNPLYGIGEPIKSGEIIDLYQQYCFYFAPEQAYGSLATNDDEANLIWTRSRKVFVRIAELMNESYNYKHEADMDPETEALLENKANFTLPKFIFLLGHQLINARQPDWSMAFVEIANSYGMEAVKEAAKDKRNNVPLGEVLKKFPVDIDPPIHAKVVREVKGPSVLPSPGERAATPDHHIDGSSARGGRETLAAAPQAGLASPA